MVNTIRNFLARLAKDERGGEVLEYALVTGLITVVAVPTITAVGQKVLSLWKSIDAAL